MKTTKLLFGSLAVLSFAACQNEEFQTNDIATPDLGREQIELSVVMDDATTKMENNNGVFEWTSDDELGASLVDVTTEGTPEDGKHIGNYKFSYVNGVFTTASTVSKGVYVFYYPYNEANTTARGGIISKLPASQKWDATGDEMMKNNFMVSPVINVAGYEGNTLELPMTMRSIYGYGTIELTNSTKETLEIQKVVINNGMEGFPIGKELAPATVSWKKGSVIGYKDANNKTHTLFADLTKQGVDAAYVLRSCDSVYTQKPGFTGSWINTTGVEKGAILVDALDENGIGVSVAPGETITTRVLIPSGVYTGGVTAVVTTDQGEETITICSSSNNYNVAAGVKKTIELEVTNVDANSSNAITVASGADLLASLKQFGSEEETITVTPVGELKLDAATVAAIPGNISLKFAKASKVTFEGNMDLDRITFTDGDASSNATVTLKNGTFNVSGLTLGASNNMVLDKGAIVTMDEEAKGGASADITVKEGAELTVASAITTYYTVDGGTLNFGQAAKTKAATEPEPIKVYTTTVNSGVVNVNVPVTVESGSYSLTLGNNKTAAPTVKSDVQANINAKVSGAFTVNKDAVVTNNSASTITTNNGTINQNGGALTVTTNNAIINNNASVIADEGTLTVNTNAADGKINTTEGSQTQVTTNNGYIYYSTGAFINGAGKGSKTEAGNVYFTVDEDMTGEELAKAFKNAPSCTAIKITNNATLTLEAIAKEATNYYADLAAVKLVVAENATMNVKVSGVVEGDDIKDFVLTNCPLYIHGTCEMKGEGTIAFAANGDGTEYCKIFVAEKATLTNRITITGVDGGIDNSGKIVNYGSISGKGNLNNVADKGSWIGNAYNTTN